MCAAGASCLIIHPGAGTMCSIAVHTVRGVQLWTRAIKMMRLGDPFALPASEKCRSA